MRTLRIVAVLLACTAVFGLAFGVGGSSSVNADRGMNVSVVDDANAFVSVGACKAPMTSNNSTNPDTTQVRIQISNQFSSAFDVDEVENRQDTGPLNQNKTNNIGPGETAEFTVVLAASDPQTVTIHVSNDHFSATITSDIYSESACSF
jgi:hypothetical protein